MAPKKSLMENYEDGTLDLSLSGIQEIPVRDIAAIPKATTLDLSCNNIITLPKNFASSLTHLVKLDLSQNHITSLPDNFGLLVNLKHLDLDNNKLESLPLSFGNLKSLRWLDLKRNPLMPKLAQIAGLCLDAQQCQAAARNVVAALRVTQDQVNAEIERRKEQKLKRMEKIEENNKLQAKENQQAKKKKKKANNNVANSNDAVHANGKKSDCNENEENELNAKKEVKTEISPQKPVQKPGFIRKMGSLLKSLVKTVVVCVVLVIFFGFILNLVDEDLYSSVQRKVVETLQSNVPKHYLKHWEHGLVVTKRAVSTWSAQAIAISVHCFKKLENVWVAVSTDEVVHQYLESLKSGWHIFWIKISDIYADLCVQLPKYFESLKKWWVASSNSTS